MTGSEFGLCVSAVLCSSFAQLFIKAASVRGSFRRGFMLAGTGVVLMTCSMFLAVVALRTMYLSQLISFAAFAYVLVPLGSLVAFNERLLPRFWIGAALILVGIACANIS